VAQQGISLAQQLEVLGFVAQTTWDGWATADGPGFLIEKSWTSSVGMMTFPTEWELNGKS